METRLNRQRIWVKYPRNMLKIAERAFRIENAKKRPIMQNVIIHLTAHVRVV